jgi:FkbM family methyltransferase
LRKKKKDHLNADILHPYSVDFLHYSLTHDIDFETNRYYSAEDEDTIRTFVDNRLKSLIPGYNQLALTDEQKVMLEKRVALSGMVSKTDGGYTLSLKEDTFFLPVNSFAEYAYIHEYGLPYLPPYVKEYVSGKVFMDIGAYIGDTTILFLKKYNPSHILAYEPVEENILRLKETIRGNNGMDKITVIEKGISDKEGELDIYVDPQRLSSSSINSFVVNSQFDKKRISLTTIDKECKGKVIGLIKMDIEGAESSAIQGALETIKRDKPVLLISLYHTGKDFFEIPLILKEAMPEYQLRFLDIEILSPLFEKILVAYPKE